MPSLKDVKTKIVGVGKTKQITKAMNMVASAKLRSAQAKIQRFQPYASKYREIMGELAQKAEGANHPLLVSHPEKKNCGIVVVTSDRGLCGGFNANIIAAALKLAKEKKAEGMEVFFYCIGRKARDAIARTQYAINAAWNDRMTSIDFPLAISIAQEVINKYIMFELDEVWLDYGEFVSIAHQPPKVMQLLPLKAPECEHDTLTQGEYVYEPSEMQLLEDLLPRYINVQIYSALLNTSASENAARMAAMDNATRNCDELINTLTLLFNKTRQASITSELIDIVGGVEALNG